jgi:hypothetical protein
VSEPLQSAAQYWALRSYRDDTAVERAYVDGILHALAVLTDPEYTLGLPTAEDVVRIEQRIDGNREAADRDRRGR